MSTDKPPYVIAQTEDGNTWFAIRDYGHRLEGLRDGTGAFLSFQSYNDKDLLGDWVLLNGGLIDRTAGREQGDLDLIIQVDGKTSGAALVGNMVEFGGPGPGFVPVVDAQMSLGNANSRWQDLWLAGKLNITTIGKQIFIDGAWQWRDCIPVNTQQGTRYLPVYAAANE